jgi:hypothetical protein
VLAHVGVLGTADTDGVEGGVMPLRGISALAVIPPPSKSVVLDSPGIELPVPADAPVI